MKVNRLSQIVLLLILSLNIQCINDDNPNSPTLNCDVLALIDSFTYTNAATNPYTINSAVLNDECLVIGITASGCDGSSWTMQLMDSGEVSESSPPQRYVKLFLVHNEDCLTVLNQVRSFDLTALQIEGVNEIIINIDDFDESITYSY